MKSDELARFRTTIASRRAELQATVSRIQQELRRGETVQADSGDQAAASYDKNALHQEAEQASRQLRLLDDSLGRIDRGDYGECLMCGREIAITRLKAIPWARYCVGCQEFQEGLAQ